MNAVFFLSLECVFCNVLYPSQVADLSMGDLLLHCTVVWINAPASLVKGKKDPELAAFGTSLIVLYFIIIITVYKTKFLLSA